MVRISQAARDRISVFGSETREIAQAGIPFNVRPGIPIFNPFVRKHLLFQGKYRLEGIEPEDVLTGLLFGNFTSFMDMKLDTYSRSRMTRHFRINPFTKKLEEILGGKCGRLGIRIGHSIAACMVAALGLVEWNMSVESSSGPGAFCVHVDLSSRFFGGRFKFWIHRSPEGAILDDDWMPERGGDVRTSTLPMACLVLTTHPVGFRQIAERITDEVVRAKLEGRPYSGEIGPPSQDLG
jgi:hypothetical protein